MKNTKSALDILNDVNSINCMPIVVPVIYCQPTTGFFFKDNDQVSVRSVIPTKIMPLSRKLIVEKDKKPLATARIDDSYFTQDFSNVKEQLEDEGFTVYETISFTMAGLVEVAKVKKARGSIEVVTDYKLVPAILAINSGTNMPSSALNSLIETITDNVEEGKSISSIQLNVEVSDEPFTTKNTQRKIYQISFSYRDKAAEKDMAYLASNRNDGMVINTINQKADSYNAPTFSGMANFVRPLNIEGLDLDDDQTPALSG